MDDELAASLGEATVVGVALLLMPASFGTDALRSPTGPASAPGAVEAWEVQVVAAVAAGFEDCTSVATPAAANFARQAFALASASSTEREARLEEVEAHAGSPCVPDTTSGIRTALLLLVLP